MTRQETRLKNLQNNAGKEISDIEIEENPNTSYIKIKRYLLEVLKITNAKRILANRNREKTDEYLTQLKDGISSALEM